MRARVAEFLLVGGATFLLVPLGWLLRSAFGLDTAEYGVGFATFYAAYVVNDPHFAVTYWLFYRSARRAYNVGSPLQRMRIVLAGLVVPALLVAWGVAAVVTRSAQSLGWMVQLMFLLVGWHYVKQGFGVVTVLSSRRGVTFTPSERHAFAFHAYAGWAFAWSNPAIPAGAFEEKGVVYWAPAHPWVLELVAGIVLAASTVVLARALWQLRDRLAGRFPLAPIAGFLITVWGWTILSAADPLFRYLIPALHAAQYFYFVALMKGAEAREAEGPPHFGRPVAVRLGALALGSLALGWLLFRGLPTFLDATRGRHAPDDLGSTPWFAALFVAVNLHHYFMDYVIWRREHPDTRFLRVAPVGQD